MANFLTDELRDAIDLMATKNRTTNRKVTVEEWNDGLMAAIQAIDDTIALPPIDFFATPGKVLTLIGLQLPGQPEQVLPSWETFLAGGYEMLTTSGVNDGTFTFQDDTAGTGDTSVQILPGLGQASELFGVGNIHVDSMGGVWISNGLRDWNEINYSIYGGFMDLPGTDGQYRFCSGANVNTTPDAAIGRADVGIVEATNGGVGVARERGLFTDKGRKVKTVDEIRDDVPATPEDSPADADLIVEDLLGMRSYRVRAQLFFQWGTPSTGLYVGVYGTGGFDGNGKLFPTIYNGDGYIGSGSLSFAVGTIDGVSMLESECVVTFDGVVTNDGADGDLGIQWGPQIANDPGEGPELLKDSYLWVEAI